MILTLKLKHNDYTWDQILFVKVKKNIFVNKFVFHIIMIFQIKTYMLFVKKNEILWSNLLNIEFDIEYKYNIT